MNSFFLYKAGKQYYCLKENVGKTSVSVKKTRNVAGASSRLPILAKSVYQLSKSLGKISVVCAPPQEIGNRGCRALNKREEEEVCMAILLFSVKPENWF